jgi:hypothetical protein
MVLRTTGVGHTLPLPRSSGGGGWSLRQPEGVLRPGVCFGDALDDRTKTPSDLEDSATSPIGNGGGEEGTASQWQATPGEGRYIIVAYACDDY